MEIIEVKPPNKVHFSVPNNLFQKFNVTNLTLRSICLYIVSAHPFYLSLYPQQFILEPFQQIEVQSILHWNQQLNSKVKSKIRIYIWQMYDDEPLQQIIKKMFNREEESCCLMFQELTIDIQIDKNHLQTKPEQKQSHKYLIERVSLPNNDLIEVSPKMIDKLIEHCEKLNKVKAIYTYANSFIVEFVDLQQHICSFFQVRDHNQNMALYSISQLLDTGVALFFPDIIVLDEIQQSSQSSIKEKLSKKKGISQYQTEGQKISVNVLTSKLGKSIKQSFLSAENAVKRRRNRSEQKMPTYEESEFDYPISYVDVDQVKEFRNAVDFENKIPKKKEYNQIIIETTKPILNLTLSQDEKLFYVVMRDCIMICPFSNPTSKKVIKFDALDEESAKLRTPTLICNNDFIFGNDCYLYWVDLAKETSEWKYVQRKAIYCLTSIDELALLVVGGKNFSKLSYLGKTTTRTNLKFYSNGQNDKHSHLFTYDIPHCQSESIVEMKYINTKPTNTKLLLALTDHGNMYFLRIKAYNEIQIYSKIQIQQIGIQRIESMQYHQQSGSLIFLEELAPKAFCFKNLKLKCSYGRVEFSTESVRLPVTNYKPDFIVGSRQNEVWILVLQKEEKNVIVWKLVLQEKEAVKLQEGRGIRRCIMGGQNIVLQEKTSLRCQILKE